MDGGDGGVGAVAGMVESVGGRVLLGGRLVYVCDVRWECGGVVILAGMARLDTDRQQVDLRR